MQVMSSQPGADIIADTLHLDLPAESQGSVVPWVIAVISGVTLLFLFLQAAKHIPESLERRAYAVLDTSGIASIYPDVSVQANGRDLHLTGSLRIDQSADPIHTQLTKVEGVNRVHQSALQVVDPAQQQRIEMQNFQNSLSDIDVSTVGFQAGSVRFTPQSETALTQLLQLLKQYPGSRMRIEGHTDNTGADTVNVRVSRERATAVANYLMRRGVAADQLVVTGYGSTRPIADNSTEDGRSRNRRIEVNPVQ